MKTYELTVEATLGNLALVTAFLEEHLEQAHCPLKAQMLLCVAAEEIFVNIANYAYAPGSGAATVHLTISDDPSAASVTFIDSGVPFDPLKKEEPDVSLPAEEREIGGLGIYMTKKSMDDVRYEYKDGQNRLTMTKKLKI